MKIEKYWSIAPFNVFSVKMGTWIFIDFISRKKHWIRIRQKTTIHLDHFLAQQWWGISRNLPWLGIIWILTYFWRNSYLYSLTLTLLLQLRKGMFSRNWHCNQTIVIFWIMHSVCSSSIELQVFYWTQLSTPSKVRTFQPSFSP